MVSLTIAITLAIAYMALQVFYIYHWRRSPVSVAEPVATAHTSFSIIIVARNEEGSIGNCINSILHQDYAFDKPEIIVIDDRSTDRTVEILQIVNDASIRLVHLKDFPYFIQPPAFKKSGIELGVHLAKNEWIIVTDADCTHHSKWLSTIASAVEKQGHVFFAGPVLLQGNNTVLDGMQQSENLALMLVTAAGIHSGCHDMANGANMIFSKKAFKSVNGYEGNYQYASGDDMFLIEKMRQQYPDKVSFIKSTEAVAFTYAKENWKSFIRQRLRWAGKNTGLRHRTIPIIWSFIGLYHVAILTTFSLALFHVSNWWPFLILLSIKWISDLFVLHESASFFGRRINVLQFVPQQMLYGFYLGYLTVMLMLNKKADW